ncbi:MAG: sulfatase-like hydrolase/transferase [Pirellulales bacterium]
MMNIACIVLDRLHWGYLGCYGNTWTATPAMDRLAAEGFVFAQALAESTDLQNTYDSWWYGTSLWQRRLDAAAPRHAALVERARASGRRTVLVTDEPLVAEHPAGAAFDEAVELEPAADDIPPAADAAATHAARIFAEAIERTSADATNEAKPFFLWLHARALGGPWDAPREYRERYVDEDDPPPPDFTAVPHERLPDDVDLDQRFGISQAYAGQVTHIDECLGGFLEHLEEAGLAANTAVVLLSPRGMALGEHGAVGPFDEHVYAELVQTACMLRLPGGRGRLRRSQALVQSSDWYHTLAELLEPVESHDMASNDTTPTDAKPRSVLPLVDEPTAVWRDRALVSGAPTADGGPTEIGIRTPAWYLRTFEESSGQMESDDADELETPAEQLFAKPDDAWEANDVADRCRDIVAGLHAAIEEFRTAAAAGNAPPPLADELLHGIS